MLTAKGTVQRVVASAMSEESDGGVKPHVERAIESSRGGGQSLDSGIQGAHGPVGASRVRCAACRTIR